MSIQRWLFIPGHSLRPLVLVQADDEATAEMIASQIPVISSLVKGARDIKILRGASEVPAGCGTEPVAVNLAVHILVKGKVNAADEIAKLEKKTTLARQGKEKLEKLAAQKNYEAIPAEVRAKNADKVRWLLISPTISAKDLFARLVNSKRRLKPFDSL